MKNLFRPFLFILVLIVVLSSLLTETSAYTLTTASNVDYYGGLLMDVFYPSEAGSYPLMIYIHGGSWEAGSKSSIPTKMKDMVTNDGYVVVSMDYGLAPSYDYPSPLVHIRKALEYLETNASTYKIDFTKIGIYGESVGGHLAALYELEFDYDNDIDIVITNSSPMDIDHTTWDADRDADTYTSGNSTSQNFYTKINQWIGYTSHTDLERMASPFWSQDRRDPTTKYLFIHTYQDNVIPRYQSKRMVEKLRAEGYYVEYKEASEAGHVGTVNNYWDSQIKPFITNNL